MLGTRGPVVALVAATVLAVGGCATAPPGQPAPVRTRSATAPAVRTVIAVSVDALNPAAIRRLGPAKTPTLHRLIAEGASTMNARTEREMTHTLPNHTGMVTGRRIDARSGGHGVTWNDERLRPPTVQKAAGHPVSSVFSVVHRAGLKTAIYASKEKFALFERSWDGAIDGYLMRYDNDRLVRRIRADISHRRRAFRFVHLSEPDDVGHLRGFMSPAYLDAVRRTDRRLGRILAVIEANPRRARHTVLLVTADHGGKGHDHFDETRLANFRVPFIAWGAGVARGADLYDLNPDYAHPGRTRTTYGGKQPIRNGDLANLVTDLLGLRRVPGSELDASQNLDVSPSTG